MGRAPCCDKANVKKGPWSPEEDLQLKEYIEKYGTGGNWIALPQKAGLRRCGKSCRLRWLNYLRPNIKHGEFSAEEDRIICTLFATIGSRWSIIAAQMPGRTDNDIKNYWNTKLKKKVVGMVTTSSSKKPRSLQNQHQNSSFQQLSSSSIHRSNSSISNNNVFNQTYYTYDEQPSNISIPFNYSNTLVNNHIESQSIDQQFYTTLKSNNHEVVLDQGSCCSSSEGFFPSGFELEENYQKMMQNYEVMEEPEEEEEETQRRSVEEKYYYHY